MGRPWWATGDQAPITYDYGGTTLYFGFYWDGSQYSSTDTMHMYRDLSGDQSSLQEYQSGTTWAQFGNAQINDSHWQTINEWYSFCLQADDGTDLSQLSEDSSIYPT